MAEYFDNGDYKLEVLKLVNYRGQEFDIRGIFSYLELYEDILSTTLSAMIGIEDAIDLYQNFPIIGKERLILQYRTSTLSPSVRVELDVYDIPSRNEIKIRHQVYVLNFMSKEGIKNQCSVLKRSLKGNIATSIKNVLQVELDTTKGIVDDGIANESTYIPARQRPFEAIQTLLNRAVSGASINHADFLLYETVDGYNIKSLNKLVMDDAKFTYKFSRLNKPSDDAPNVDEFFVIGNYEIVQSSAPGSAITNGMYGCTLGVYDPIRREYKEKTYDYLENKDDFNFLSDHLTIARDDDRQKAAKDAVFKYVIKGTKDETLLARNAKFEQLFNNIRIVVDVAGNSELRVGHIIKLDVPSNTDIDIQQATKERFLKGKYLIASIKHSFHYGTGGYRSVMELVKDSIDYPIEDSAELFDRISA
jgi:hypothetical protein